MKKTTANQKVMIIDDNKDFLEELKEILFSCGYDVTGVSDSVVAYRVARRIKPDVILLDLRMNKLNGFQLAEQLRQSEATAGIPIIAMSGYFPLERHSVLLDMSKMDSRIKKPFTVSELITQIENVLNRKEHSGELLTGAHAD